MAAEAGDDLGGALDLRLREAERLAGAARFRDRDGAEQPPGAVDVIACRRERLVHLMGEHRGGLAHRIEARDVDQLRLELAQPVALALALQQGDAEPAAQKGEQHRAARKRGGDRRIPRHPALPLGQEPDFRGPEFPQAGPDGGRELPGIGGVDQGVRPLRLFLAGMDLGILPGHVLPDLSPEQVQPAQLGGIVGAERVQLAEFPEQPLAPGAQLVEHPDLARGGEGVGGGRALREVVLQVADIEDDAVGMIDPGEAVSQPSQVHVQGEGAGEDEEAGDHDGRHAGPMLAPCSQPCARTGRDGHH